MVLLAGHLGGALDAARAPTPAPCTSQDRASMGYRLGQYWEENPDRKRRSEEAPPPPPPPLPQAGDLLRLAPSGKEPPLPPTS